MEESKCPFLRASCSVYATHAPPSVKPVQPMFQDQAGFEAAFRLFHGPAGLLPLPHAESVLRGPLLPFFRGPRLAQVSSDAAAVVAACPFAGASFAASTFSLDAGVASSPVACAPDAARAAASLRTRLAALPLATASFSAFPLFGGEPPHRRGVPGEPGSARRVPPSPAPGSTPVSNGAGTAGHAVSAAAEAGFLVAAHDAVGSHGAETVPRCPLAKWPRLQQGLGQLFGMGAGSTAHVLRGMHLHLECPAPVLAMRRALAASPHVQALRPKPLPAKILAVAAASLVMNVPLGMWRVHTTKFSPEWFLAVHAAIPFIVSLRKAVVMPQSAIAVTIGAAVLGQVLGSRLEKRRIEEFGPLPQLRLISTRGGRLGGGTADGDQQAASDDATGLEDAANACAELVGLAGSGLDRRKHRRRRPVSCRDGSSCFVGAGRMVTAC